MFGLTPYRKNAIQISQPVFDIGRLFEDFFSDAFLPAAFHQMGGIKVDIKDTEKAYVLEADLPGVNKEDLKLEFEDGRLTIMVERDERLESDKENYLHRERRFYSTSRSFSFEDVNQDQISAKYENGVLSVTLPKSEIPSRNKRIQIS
ncbi:MAG: Hsp20/alpha crystallin family protein [Desulfitobacteriaceae bacterium]|nr:Hsp20/alpha crystallin family protein [Desulfitobacteriaceae bacterium]MDI6916027.1 Hsp20/alpha crystallin family protein [Desulfitobacteriaceae bacterium]